MFLQDSYKIGCGKAVEKLCSYRILTRFLQDSYKILWKSCGKAVEKVCSYKILTRFLQDSYKILWKSCGKAVEKLCSYKILTRFLHDIQLYKQPSNNQILQALATLTQMMSPSLHWPSRNSLACLFNCW